QDYEDRVLHVVQQTAGATVGSLTRKGWFLQPADRDSTPKSSPFDYIVKQGKLSIETFDLETEINPPPQTRTRTEPAIAAEREYLQWAWLQRWDVQVKSADGKDLKNLQHKIEQGPRELPDWKRKESPNLHIKLGPKTAEGFPSVVIQVLSENGDGNRPAGGEPGSQPDSSPSPPG
ncbi:MAG TPA: hypothetical protein VIW92_03825, partial [Thermoanaerobaculia bacterium]